MKFKIAITEKFHPAALELLKTHSKVEIISTGAMPAKSELTAVEGLIIRSRTTINEDLLNKIPNLKWIISTTAGFDHIDLRETQKRGVVVMTTPEAHAESVAELTLTLMLAVNWNLGARDRDVRQGTWRSPHRSGSVLLSGKSLGIVGLGRIGQRVAQLAKAHGINILACDPYQNDDVFGSLGLARLSYEELVRSADIVSFHVPLTPRTHSMYNLETLECVPDGQIVINTSRGAVVQEAALIDGLRTGVLGGAGLDVFEHEPVKKDSSLSRFENVVLTPHIGAMTEPAFYRASLDGAHKAIAWIERAHTSDTAPPKTAWYSDGFENSDSVE